MAQAAILESTANRPTVQQIFLPQYGKDSFREEASAYVDPQRRFAITNVHAKGMDYVTNRFNAPNGGSDRSFFFPYYIDLNRYGLDLSIFLPSRNLKEIKNFLKQQPSLSSFYKHKRLMAETYRNEEPYEEGKIQVSDFTNKPNKVPVISSGILINLYEWSLSELYYRMIPNNNMVPGSSGSPIYEKGKLTHLNYAGDNLRGADPKNGSLNLTLVYINGVWHSWEKLKPAERQKHAKAPKKLFREILFENFKKIKSSYRELSGYKDFNDYVKSIQNLKGNFPGAGIGFGVPLYSEMADLIKESDIKEQPIKPVHQWNPGDIIDIPALKK